MFRENSAQRLNEISVLNNKLWGVILAGGEGTRLKNFVKRLYGYNRPKQYCRITGEHSLVRETISRAHKIIPNNKILTVVTSHHSRYYKEELRGRPHDTILVQPSPRGTGAGIFYPVMKIHRSDPDSIAAIFPSDHFVREENKFIYTIGQAVLFVERNPELIVAIGIRPGRIESGLGWIVRGEKIHSFNDLNFYTIERFCEKPDAETARSLFLNQGLVNTFVIIGKSKTLINGMNKYLPRLSAAFEPIRRALGTEYENDSIRRHFKHLPALNFSTEFLQRNHRNLAVLELNDVYWSDWGEEARIRSDMERFNLSFTDNSNYAGEKKRVRVAV